MSADAAAVQRAPASALHAELQRTIVAVRDDAALKVSSLAIRDASPSSLSRPSWSSSQRRPDAPPVFTSAISDEEEEEGNEDEDDDASDDYSDYEGGEEKEQAATKGTSATPPPRNHFTSTSATGSPQLRSQQHNSQTRSPLSSAAAAAASKLKKSTVNSSPASLAGIAHSSDVFSLSGCQWRQQLRLAKQQLMDRRYSRGELSVEHTASPRTPNSENDSTQTFTHSSRRPSDTAPPQQRPTAHTKSMSSIDLPAFSPLDGLVDSSHPSRFTSPFDSSLLPSTTRSDLPPSHSAAAALKHSTFAKDREGMEQERRELLQEKRRIVTAIAQHERELLGVIEEYAECEAGMMRLTEQRGMMRVREGTSSRFERRAQIEDGRLNPTMSTAQLVRALQCEIQQLRKDKEEREEEQDARDAQDREDEERWTQGRGAADDETKDGEEDVVLRGERRTRRGRLLEVREQKRLLFERLHHLQDELLEGRRRAALDVNSQEKVASLARLEGELQRVQSENEEYQQQRRRATERLERSMPPHSPLISRSSHHQMIR